MLYFQKSQQTDGHHDKFHLIRIPIEANFSDQLLSLILHAVYRDDVIYLARYMRIFTLVRLVTVLTIGVSTRSNSDRVFKNIHTLHARVGALRGDKI